MKAGASTRITKAELLVMDVLWKDNPLPAAAIAEQLSDKTNWSLKTVKTLLSRLAEKGAITHEPDGRRFLYQPKVTRRSYAQRATRSLADQLFGGRAAPLIAHLAEGGGLSPDDVRDLEALLEELKRDSN